MTVLIAGAGIGGLVTALSLHQIGVKCRVFETVPEIRPLGVGINLLPHAVRELYDLGLESELAAAGVQTTSLSYHTKRGQLIWREPRGKFAGYKWPQFSIHRGMFQMLLLKALRQRLGEDAIVTGQALDEWHETDGEITAVFNERRSGQATEAKGSVLIAADGIHSAARRKLYPGEGPPLWNGLVLWRGVTQGISFGDGRSMIMAGNATQKFVAYPIAPESAGEPVLNWIAERRLPERQFAREDWNRPGNLADFLPAFADWRFDWLNVPAVIAGGTCLEYPMVDRDPLERWTFGRATLLGDAAHAMYPIGSNGASQAILDARVLAREIRSHGATPQALMAYEAERRAATTPIVLANRQMGPERVMQLVEERKPEGFVHIEDILSREELEAAAGSYKRVAGFSIAELNARPAILS